MRKNKIGWLIGLVISIVVVLVAGIGILLSQRNRDDNQDIYADLMDQVNDIDIDEEDPLPEELSDLEYLSKLGIEVPQKNIDWEGLSGINEDIYAWIALPELEVDYPILQHPSDNEYYLKHNIDGSEGFPGCIYTENYNKRDFTDPNTLVYGHNLKDKTMFSALHKFENEETFAGDHYIFVYTPERTLCYEVFAAYEAPAIHQILNYDYTNPYVYEDYLKEIFNPQGRVSSYKEGYEVTKEDKIITLSTCTRDSSDVYRYLCQGKLLNP